MTNIEKAALDRLLRSRLDWIERELDKTGNEIQIERLLARAQEVIAIGAGLNMTPAVWAEMAQHVDWMSIIHVPSQEK